MISTSLRMISRERRERLSAARAPQEAGRREKSAFGARLALLALLALSAPVATARAQDPPGRATDGNSETDRLITVSFHEAPIRDVLFAFADYSGGSIVADADVEGLVSAEIRNRPWREALRTILEAHGLLASERDGIMRVADAATAQAREAVDPLVSRAYRVRYADAADLGDAVRALLTDRGRVSSEAESNTLVVTDVPRVLDAAKELVGRIDRRAPQVDIAARIIFVNRAELEGFGVTYDLKDTRGNQLNARAPGVADLNGDGEITLPDERVPRGTDVVSLGGSSIAALGNAANGVLNPTLSVLASLVMGRSTLVSFIDALEALELTEVEARPSVRVMSNRTARIVVGEETPVRVIDAGARQEANSGGAAPVATVDYKETGVILEVTPRVTSEGEVLMSLSAERSSADLAPSDVGVVFRRQQAESRLLVKDGESVVIAGLTVTERGEVVSGIPLLMHLPLVGRLFRSRTESIARRDLVIMVTPKIVALAPG